jgi:hypothetical protein
MGSYEYLESGSEINSVLFLSSGIYDSYCRLITKNGVVVYESEDVICLASGAKLKMGSGLKKNTDGRLSLLLECHMMYKLIEIAIERKFVVTCDFEKARKVICKLNHLNVFHYLE